MESLRSVTLLPWVIFLIAFPPIRGFEASFEGQTGLYRPSSLDDCVNLATRQLSRWKQVYGICITMFFNKDRPPVKSDQSDSLSNFAMTTDAQYHGVTDINTGISSLYSVKRSPEAVHPDSGTLHQDPFTNEANNDVSDDDVKRWSETNQQQQKWSSVIGRSVMRTRRQHSLSINSALVSLADMLMAKDYSREKARQRAFRQQLLGLGR